MEEKFTYNGMDVTYTGFDRGFTGHEHLSRFGLVNMDGRMYDPSVSSFLSADRYVQDPSSAQGFNRYAYCMYNPLRYVDPTGFYVTYGDGHGHDPDGPLEQVVINGQVGFLIPEVTITPFEDFPKNWNVPIFVPNDNGGNGGDLSFGKANEAPIIGPDDGNGHGGGNGGRVPNDTHNPNNNIEIASKLLNTFNLYTTIEATLHFNWMTRTWLDKNGNFRSFDCLGNQYTGGIFSYGKAMSNRYAIAGRVFGLSGVALSFVQLESATTEEGKLEYGFDAFIGLAGVMAPEYFGLPSTIWFLGGKQVSFWYGRTTIIPMIVQGINPGLMIYQPFK